MEHWDVLVIGAGPAGMMAASTAALQGSRVLLIERNEKAGRKLAITGKGRCNVTNAADISTFQEQMVNNPRFALSATHRFTNRDLMQMIEELGVPLKVERGERVFPESDKAFDIVDALVRRCRRNRVKMHFSERVQTVEAGAEGFRVETESGVYMADQVIITTGGISYPTTGSTGDGYRFAEGFGHSIEKPVGGLVPLQVKEAWPKELMGLSLRNVGIRVTCRGKNVYQDFGEMLFTHFGLTGPVVLSASSRIGAFLRRKKTDYASETLLFHIDMKPALTEEQLETRISRDLEKYAARQLLHALEDLLPKRMIPVVLEQAGLQARITAGALSVSDRRKLRAALKDLTCTVTGTRPPAEAIITQGGVDVRQIDPKTMESKLVPGLYFAGEVLDIDALTGGFNLQLAFSTGYTAGLCAGSREEKGS